MTRDTGRWLDQVERLARDALPGPVFRYVEEGARDEVTLREAEQAWRELRVLPRVLHDVRRVDVAGSMLGRTFRAPVGVAPMTLQRAADPEGEVAMARAAAAAAVPLVVSSNAGRTFADIAATGVTWWLQLYAAPDRSGSEPLLEAAVAAGAAGVVLTADTPVVGRRYPAHGVAPVWESAPASWLGANLVVGDDGGADASYPGADHEPAGPGEASTGEDARWRLAPDQRDKAQDLGPEDVARLAALTGLPVVVKGVLRAEDARRCVDAGASAVWVSNHGGRQLDRTVATARCVASVRAAVGTGAEVFVDGGVRSGLDVVLAVGLGADGVFVGRPLFHALAAAGADGVARALEELRTEAEETLRLAGCATWDQTAGIVTDRDGQAPASRL